jgi:hypothetical protein
MKIRPVLRGIASYFPGFPWRKRSTGGTIDARYCLNTWNCDSGYLLIENKAK